MLHIFGIQDFISRQGVETSRGSNNDVWAFGFVAEKFSVLCDGSSTIEGGNPNVREVLGKTSVFVLDLEGQLSSVTENEDGYFAVHWLQLLESGKDENSGLSVTRLGLTEHVHTENGLGNAFLLN